MAVATPAETAVLDEATVETVQAAWTAYDLAERELWQLYAATPNYVEGRLYLAGEQLARRRCERRIERIRFARGPRVRK